MRRLGVVALAAAAAAAIVSCQPKGRAHAERISTRKQLIGGPKALGQIGDYLLENDKIRVIIHGPGPNRGSTLFGGSLLDADLQRPSGKGEHGNDQLGEVFPAFLFEAMDPESFEVTRDGSDGGAAVVTVEGGGGDLLQTVAVMNTGLLYPPGLRFRSEYRLEPGARHVEIVTTITNVSNAPHPLPYLDPPELAGLGLDIPGLDQLTLSVPLGHLALFGAGQHLFAQGKAGFNVRFAIEDEYPVAAGFPAFPGLVTDLLATRGDGVSYGIAVPSSASNYPGTFASLYPGQTVTNHGLLIPYLYSSVTGVFHTNPPPVLAPGESFSYPVWFIVGRGDVGSVLDVAHELRGTVTGAFAGRVVDETTSLPIPGASVVVQEAPSGRYVSQFTTEEDGGFRGTLPPGSYRYRVVTEVRKTSDPEPFTVTAGDTTSVLVRLPAPGTLAIQVRDELGRLVPSKITLVGEFPAELADEDPRTFLYDLAVGEAQRSTAFDPNRAEYIEKAWYADGTLVTEVRPTDYFLVVSRGLEYDVHTAPIRVRSGTTVERVVALKRGVDTDGWIGADLHLHARPSLDSSMSLEDRVLSCAGEGLEFIVSTDHNFVSDYLPSIAKLGLEEWLTSSVGLELTTFEMGHFNGYPLNLDPGSVRGGEFTWAGEPPESLFSQLRSMGKHGPDGTIVQVNHPRDNVLGYFSQFNMVQETGEAEVRIGLRGVFAPYGEEFAPEAFRLDFDALEILNGKRRDIEHTYVVPNPLPPGPIPSPAPTPGTILRDEYGQIAFPGIIEDWHTLLNRGMRHTGVGASDSHKGLTQEPGFPRTYFYVGAGDDVAGGYDEKDVVTAIQEHRAIATNGPFVELTVNGAGVGSDVVDGDGEADVRIRVRSADWIPFDRVRLYANGTTVLDETVPVGQRHDWTRQYSLAVTTADTWVMVEVTGDDNLFPVLAPQEFEPLSATKVIDALGSALDLSGLDPYGALRPKRTYQATPVAITNPIWIDRDGDGFDAPLPPPSAAPRPARDIDLREVFEAMR